MCIKHLKNFFNLASAHLIIIILFSKSIHSNPTKTPTGKMTNTTLLLIFQFDG